MIWLDSFSLITQFKVGQKRSWLLRKIVGGTTSHSLPPARQKFNTHCQDHVFGRLSRNCRRRRRAGRWTGCPARPGTSFTYQIGLLQNIKEEKTGLGADPIPFDEGTSEQTAAPNIDPVRASSLSRQRDTTKVSLQQAPLTDLREKTYINTIINRENRRSCPNKAFQPEKNILTEGYTYYVSFPLV